MWREFFNSFGRPCIFGDPASAESISHLEQSLCVLLPTELRELFTEMDGVSVYPAFFEDNSEDAAMQVLWTLDEVREENQRLRTIAIFEHLLFFACEPNGDPIGYAIVDGKIIDPQLIVMSHEDYEDRRVQCHSLRAYLTILMEASQ